MRPTALAALFAALPTVLSLAGAARAGTVFVDTFESNSPASLAAKTFSTGAKTSFNYWAAGTSGDMDAGYFSVVNKAHDVHSQFVSSFDADHNAAGHYAIFNGFQNAEGMAYSISFSNLIPGQTYDFSVALLPLAGNPPYPQVSELQIRQNGSALGPAYTLNPVAYGTEQWLTLSRSFVATSGTNTLGLYNLAGASNAGNDFGIDNVTLSSRAFSAVVPLPASAGAGLAGLAGLTLVRKRR